MLTLITQKNTQKWLLTLTPIEELSSLIIRFGAVEMLLFRFFLLTLIWIWNKERASFLFFLLTLTAFISVNVNINVNIMKRDKIESTREWLGWIIKEHGNDIGWHNVGEITALMDDLKIEIERNKMACNRAKRHRQKK